MKKIIFLCMLTSLSAFSADGEESIGWKNTINPKVAWGLGGVMMLGHLGANIMSAYFQMLQNTEIEKIPYTDNEVGVVEEDKRCGRWCQLNTEAIRSAGRYATGLNGVATFCSALSATFNVVAISIWISMLAHWDRYEEYEDNIRKWERVAIGISAFKALLLNAPTTGLMADAVANRRDEVPLKTLAPLELAVFSGTGYWAQMAIFGGIGIVSFAKWIEGLRSLGTKIHEMGVLENVPVIAPHNSPDNSPVGGDN